MKIAIVQCAVTAVHFSTVFRSISEFTSSKHVKHKYSLLQKLMVAIANENVV